LKLGSGSFSSPVHTGPLVAFADIVKELPPAPPELLEGRRGDSDEG
jgi:hypothetical protein